MLKWWAYRTVCLYLLNFVICHVGFYKNGKYKNKESLFSHLTLLSFYFSPLHLLAYSLSATAILIYHLQLDSLTTHVRPLRRKGCQQGGCSQ